MTQLALYRIGVAGLFGKADHVDFRLNENIDDGTFAFIEVYDKADKPIKLDDAKYRKLCDYVVKYQKRARIAA